MSRFADREIERPEELDAYDPAVDCWCAFCGVQFNGSDSSGGHHGGLPPDYCCQSFRSLRTFDDHFTGDRAEKTRRCMTPDEMLAAGWSVDDNKVWRLPAPAVSPWKKETSA